MATRTRKQQPRAARKRTAQSSVGTRRRADQAPLDSSPLRQELVKRFGSDPRLGWPMTLVERILDTENSPAVRGTALHELLHRIGWEQDPDERHFAALIAGFYTLFYQEDWLAGMRWLTNKMAAAAQRKGKRAP